MDGRELPDHLREYQLVKLGLSILEIEEAPAMLCDELLAIDSAIAEGQEMAQR